MLGFLSRARLAGLVAGAMVILLAGVAVGAAGSPIIMGLSNSAGTSNTTLSTASSGTAWYVFQNGTGTAMRANATATDAIAGFYTSANGPGISGVTANATKYGVYAANDAATSNGGAALRANGKQNEAIVATSAEDTAIVATASGCTGFICGSHGVSGTGSGFAAGIFGSGEGSIAGVFGSAGTSGWGVLASSSVVSAPATVGLNASGIGVAGNGANGSGPNSCGLDTDNSWYCAGGDFSGDNGLIAYAETPVGVGVIGVDNTGGAGYGVMSDGDAIVWGDLSVSGTITGALTAIAVNASDSTLRAGDAVTLVGVSADADGRVLLRVAPARKGDAVIGLVDRSMSKTADKIQVEASERNIETGQGDFEFATPARTLGAQVSTYKPAAATVAAGSALRVVTYGALVFEGSVDAAIGDVLAVGDATGKLGKEPESNGSGAAVGRFLGKLEGGRVAVFVNPG